MEIVYGANIKDHINVIFQNFNRGDLQLNLSKTVPVIITVLKNYICVHMKNILFMINFIQYVLKFGHFRSLHDASVDSAV